MSQKCAEMSQLFDGWTDLLVPYYACGVCYVYVMLCEKKLERFSRNKNRTKTKSEQWRKSIYSTLQLMPTDEWVEMSHRLLDFCFVPYLPNKSV